MKLNLNENVTLTVERKFIAKSLGLNLTNSQKVKTAIEMAEYYGKTIDMSYIEDLLVEAAKTRLKSIKKDKALYHRNRQYFNALKAITKIKSAE
jgi:3-keto-L-gulonate-6-phosphate decarboxylase